MAGISSGDGGAAEVGTQVRGSSEFAAPDRARSHLAVVGNSPLGHRTGEVVASADPDRNQRVRHVRNRVEDLITCVGHGRVYEAIEEFYDPDVCLSPGAMAPMFCLDPRIARDDGAHRDMVWERFSADGVGVNGDTSFVECELEFSVANGRRFTTRYVAIAQWRDGKIVRESLQAVS